MSLKPCMSDLAIEFLNVSALVIFFLIEFDITYTSDLGLSSNVWVVIAQSFEKFMNLEMRWIYKQGIEF